MKLDKIILELKDIARNYDYSEEELIKLIKKLEQEYKETLVIKNTSDKTRLNIIKKFLHNPERPILQCYTLFHGKVAFTDGYALYVLNDEYLPFKIASDGKNTEEVEKMAKEHNLELDVGVYPYLENIIPDESNAMYNFTVDLKEVLSACKTQEKDIRGLKPYDLKVNEETVVTIDLLKLETLIKIMRIKDDFELKYYGENRPITYNNNGEIGLILPIRRF